MLTDAQMCQWVDQVQKSKEEAERASTKQVAIQVQLDLVRAELASAKTKLAQAQSRSGSSAYKVSRHLQCVPAFPLW